MRTSLQVLMLSAFVLLAGCEDTYYGMMERFNFEKRDILVDRIQHARDTQEEAKDTFRSALDQFQAVIDFEGGGLEDMYQEMKAEYELSEDVAEELSERIDKVDNVAEDLFEEWEAELDDYTSAELRAASKVQLMETKSDYDRLISSMRRVEVKMSPVLEAFEDQVLFLKHNLNAVAISTLDDEFAAIRASIETLVEEMEDSISTAEAFINEMMKS